jgi:hypothetical protein
MGNSIIECPKHDEREKMRVRRRDPLLARQGQYGCRIQRGNAPTARASRRYTARAKIVAERRQAENPFGVRPVRSGA